MRFIEEIVVEEFLPTVRSMLAAELRAQGLTQTDVAGVLGISQSAVSKYSHGDVERNDAVLNHPRVETLVSELAVGLANEEISQVQALIEIEVCIRQLERGGVLAKLHEDAVPELAAHDELFDVHDAESRLRASERTLGSVRRGLRLLEQTSGIATLIPAVGSNLVECLPRADGIEDVAGIPGRILDVKGRVTVPAEPEFGASGHVASVLLACRQQNPAVRATLNVAYSPETIAQLESDGLECVEFDPEQALSDAIEPVLSDTTDVLYQTGAMGIEPVVYLLGEDAPTVSSRAKAIVETE
ncbi:thiamine-phosphate synthase family protein [Halocatena halophila]|uniref:thiamine-phosphate synthase family protein n=1 Tax=Halocatena halophila TaxID=2814576 RepID=UPI002ED433B7